MEQFESQKKTLN